jgi:hypothetical protein
VTLARSLPKKTLANAALYMDASGELPSTSKPWASSFMVSLPWVLKSNAAKWFCLSEG